ncbi:hypothetical protein DPMN_161500 [Dreissena polymorpha]|uniref:Uncharacterized protein n=1 Tax=Dreissena polymorpha TaxID=45954 RepID=A0A9D4ITG6_DREPO|nr:hypothetical protein DPMN_161500 [Dreissena polymorpha]
MLFVKRRNTVELPVQRTSDGAGYPAPPSQRYCMKALPLALITGTSGAALTTSAFRRNPCGAVKTPGIIYGTEYETHPSVSPVFNHLHEHEVPCAVCCVSTSNVLMVPGRNACYTGWTLEYAGYLMAERYTSPSNKNFVCVDSDAEPANCSSGGNEDGAYFYVVESSCNPLKCPPYVSGRELTCAVCSYKK